jgi:hypothetical protein
VWYWGKIRFLKWGSDPNLRNTPNWDMVMRQIERVMWGGLVLRKPKLLAVILGN